MTQRRTDEFCQNRVNPYPFYSPRFWAGMRLWDYIRLMVSNRFRIHPLRIPMAFLVGGCAVASSILAFFQRLTMGRRIQAVQPNRPPIFVIGHWRSGTTLLHELFCVDRQFGYPTTFECFVPSHHLLSRRFLRPLVRMLMPGKRPMDAMPVGPDLPQEDEFALIGLGAPTPYYHLAFCNEEPRHVEMLNLKHAGKSGIRQLRDALTWFYRSISLADNRQLVLKSPTHTGRIGHLARWFPDARFVHITRHPYKIFPSTVHLWKSLAQVQGYQLPERDDHRLVDYVHRCYREMYDGYFGQIDGIPAENVVQVRFDDLIDDPVGQMQQIYSSLGIDGFESVQPELESFWNQRKSHRSNQTNLTDATRRQIDEIWADYMERFGYEAKEGPQ